MPSQEYEDSEITRLYNQFRPSYPDELLEKILNYLKEKDEGPFELAVDVGCGSGQATRLLSPHFQKVCGFDISENQINQAKKYEENSNLKFQVSPSESLPLKDKSVNLMTAATCAHWFDLPVFFVECERILKKNGVLAMFSYDYPTIINHENSDKMNAKILDLFRVIYDHYPDEIKTKSCFLDKYQSMNPPFATDLERYYSYSIKYTWTYDHLIKFIESFCGYQSYLQQNPNGNLLKQFIDETTSMIDINQKLNIEFQFYLVICRKS